MFSLIRDKSDNHDFQFLKRILDDELNTRYGILQAQYDEFNNVDDIDTAVIGYIDNVPAGCGCFKSFNEDTIEIKRMFVRSEFRGSGIAKMILTELEKWAIENGFANAVLETGIKQPEAIKFYAKLGYDKIENYGQYLGNSNSICMRKELRNH